MKSERYRLHFTNGIHHLRRDIWIDPAQISGTDLTMLLIYHGEQACFEIEALDGYVARCDGLERWREEETDIGQWHQVKFVDPRDARLVAAARLNGRGVAGQSTDNVRLWP